MGSARILDTSYISARHLADDSVTDLDGWGGT